MRCKGVVGRCNRFPVLVDRDHSSSQEIGLERIIESKHSVVGGV